jgi:hypothetical protein
MATAHTDTTPYGATSATLPQFGKLTADAEADVVVVGGGITRVHSAGTGRSNRQEFKPIHLPTRTPPVNAGS